MRLPFWPLLLSAALLAGCVNYEKEREAYLSTMVGLSEAELIQRMGVPKSTYEANGHKFLAYEHQSESYMSEDDFGGGFGMMGMGGPYGFGEPSFGGGEVDVSTCQTVFDVVQGYVQSFSRHGDGC
jgi:hypothetical protein